MRTVIDESVNHAKTYYETYLHEPSPAGDFKIAVDEITSFKKLDFFTVLKAMEEVGAGGELLVVTHSGPDGFLMALKPGGKAALRFDVMDKIDAIAEAIRQREAIQAGDSKAWRDWFLRHEPGVDLAADYATDPGWKDYVEREYGAWHRRQGDMVLKLPKGSQDLSEMLALLQKVRKAALKRVEFRACRTGKDADAVKRLAEFLGAKTVVCPKDVPTFYGVINDPTVIADEKKYSQAVKKMGGRSFPGISLTILTLVHGMRLIARSNDDLKEFVKKYIRADFSGKIPPFVIGGVEANGAVAGKLQIYPLDKEYKSLMIQYSAKAAGTP